MGRYDPTEATIDELRAAGVEPTEVKQTGGGHHKIYFKLNGKCRFIVVAATPTDWRSDQNNRSVLRGIIKQEENLIGKSNQTTVMHDSDTHGRRSCNP